MSTEPSSSERRIEQDLMVIGEAVALEVVPASLGSRLLSGIIDYGTMLVGLVLSLATFSLAVENDYSMTTARLAAVLSLVVFTWLVALPLLIESASNGRSLGRLVMGTRVVRDDGGSVRLRHSLVRVLLSVIEVWFTQGVLCLITCVATRRNKRLGDVLAGTYVIQERAAARRTPPVLMPPELAAWARQADIRGLPGHLALVVRTFLSRTTSFQPAVRAHLATELAAQVATCVSPPPPPRTHPERFLAAVLAERRDRELLMELQERQAEEEAVPSLL